MLSWMILVGFAGAMLALSPRLRGGDRVAQFFSGRDEAGRAVGLGALTASLLISWIFAKSIQNAANLGQSYGAPGSLAYAAYWLSFLVAGVVIYRIRMRGFDSIHHFLRARFGSGAVWLFSLILLLRLWNEIWSNNMVVAQFFGQPGSASFLIATWASTFLVLAYALKSGLRSSIFTDTIQMALAAVLLVAILGIVLPRAGVVPLVTAGEWSLAGGVDLLLVALVQVWSYPFHDPVMTDRGFITDARKMRTAFVLAGMLGVLFVFLFGFVGIFNRVAGLGGNATMTTALRFGAPMLLMMNLIMLTSAASTLDSTFASTGKLVAVDLLGALRLDRIRAARIAMVVLAVLGALMVHASPAILSATTVSGTMVIGLTPVFVLAGWRRPGPLSYYLAVAAGLGFGLLVALKAIPFAIGTGAYGSLLWANLVGLGASFFLYVAGAWIAPARVD